MLNLNLLPPQEKLHLAYRLRTRAVAAVLIGLTVSFTVFLFLLLPSYLAVRLQESEVLRSLSLERERQVEAGNIRAVEDARAAHRLAAVVLNHEEKRLNLTPLLTALLKDAPNSLRLDLLRFRPDRNELALEGFAPVRADLMGFLRLLEQNPRVARVSSPVSNLIRERDIKFALVVELKKSD